MHTAVLWGFFTLQYYFGTGHDFSFTKIQWSSACIPLITNKQKTKNNKEKERKRNLIIADIGFEENNLIRSAFLTLLNTFSAPLLFTLLLPFLVLYSHGLSELNPHSTSSTRPPSKSHAKLNAKTTTSTLQPPTSALKLSLFVYLRTPLLLCILFPPFVSS